MGRQLLDILVKYLDDALDLTILFIRVVKRRINSEEDEDEEEEEEVDEEKKNIKEEQVDQDEIMDLLQEIRNTTIKTVSTLLLTSTTFAQNKNANNNNNNDNVLFENWKQPRAERFFNKQAPLFADPRVLTKFLISYFTIAEEPMKSMYDNVYNAVVSPLLNANAHRSIPTDVFRRLVKSATDCCSSLFSPHEEHKVVQVFTIIIELLEKKEYVAPGVLEIALIKGADLMERISPSLRERFANQIINTIQGREFYEKSEHSDDDDDDDDDNDEYDSENDNDDDDDDDDEDDNENDNDDDDDDDDDDDYNNNNNNVDD